MNNGIKHSGLMLAGGVLLADIIHVATDIIGVGNFGGFFRCDAVIRNGTTREHCRRHQCVELRRWHRAPCPVDVADGGSGYQLAGNPCLRAAIP